MESNNVTTLSHANNIPCLDAGRGDVARLRGRRGGAAALALVLVLTGCSAVPELEPFAMPGAASYPSGDAYAKLAADNNAKRIAALDWRQVYPAGELQQLIARALQHNRNLKGALASLEASFELVRLNQLTQVPRVSFSVGSGIEQSSTDTQTPGLGAAVTTHRVSVGVQSFDFDLGGRAAAQNAAAAARHRSGAQAVAAMRVALVAEIAQLYASRMTAMEYIRGLRRQGEVLHRVREINRGIVASGAGVATQVRAIDQALLALAAGEVEQIRLIAEIEQALAVLVGGAVTTTNVSEIAPDGNAGDTEADVFVVRLDEFQLGAPADLLRDRPDIRAAEQSLLALNADIDAARAAMYPTLSLSALTGLSTSFLFGEAAGNAGNHSISLNLLGTIFGSDAIEANIGRAVALRRAALLRYEDTILQALRDVANALSARRAAIAQTNNLKQQLELARKNEAHRNDLWRHGAGSIMPVLAARQEVYRLESLIARSSLALAQTSISLYSALGGGGGETTTKSAQTTSAAASVPEGGTPESAQESG